MMKPDQHSNCNQFDQLSASDRAVSGSNLTPSMVARQQRALHATSAATSTTKALTMPQPAPRTSFMDPNQSNNKINNHISQVQDTKCTNQHQKPQFDQNGLILAKRLAQNPNLVMLSTVQPNIHQNDSASIHFDSNNNNKNTITQHDLSQNVRGFGNLMRDLTRELKFNQISGKNVLDQKSELKRVQERIAETRRRKEAEQERLNRRSSLELRLEERAQKIAKDGSD